MGKKVESEEFKRIIQSSGKWSDAMQKLSIYGVVDQRSAQRRAKRQGLVLSSKFEASQGKKDEESVLEVIKLQRELKTLRVENKNLLSQAANTSELKQFIHGCVKHEPEIPEWLGARNLKTKNNPNVPSLMLSDFHWDEIVYPTQVNGANQYNRKIAVARLQRVTDTTIDILCNKLKFDYPGIVVPLAGDMMTGYIHEELKENVDYRLFQSVLSVCDNLITTIDKFKDNFGSVFLPCVVGNHGRLDKKPRMKYGVVDNVDWLLYQLLDRHYADNDNVTFLIPDSPDAYFKIFDIRYMLTHGNQFKGGLGIAGPLIPWALGNYKKKQRQAAINQPYDTLLFGHWHTTSIGINNGWICGNTLKGYDEYAYNSNFPFSRPEQSMWLTHPEHGITSHWPIYADESPVPTETNWVSVPERE